MRKLGRPSEIGRFAEPLARVLDGAWQRMHWWIAAMAILYLLSGITIIRPDEVAVVLRWGRLVGNVPALQEHGPGLLFAFPRPVDEVVRVQTKHIWEVPVNTLSTYSPDNPAAAQAYVGNTLDPVSQGYSLTGDENIVHVNMVARYRVKEPALWAFYGPKDQDILRVEVTQAMMRSLGEMGVDRVLSDGRKDLITIASKRAQEGLDASHSGLELSSLELTALAPPQSLASDFDAVQSAFIRAETMKKDAEAYAAAAIPQAQNDADRELQSARAQADADLSAARGEAGAFLAIDKEYKASPMVVRERLYRDAVEKAISMAGKVRWIPPPMGGNYNGFRITIQPTDAGYKSAESQQSALTPPPTPYVAPSPPSYQNRSGNYQSDYGEDDDEETPPSSLGGK